MQISNFVRVLVSGGFVFALSLAGGCATALIAPGTMPEFQPQDGVVVFVSDSDARITSMYFQSPDQTSDLRVSNIDPGNHLVAIKAPEGPYCVREIIMNQSVAVYWAEGGSTCFEVRAGKIAYLRHLNIRNLKMQTTNDIVDAAERLRVEYPALTTKFGTPVPGR